MTRWLRLPLSALLLVAGCDASQSQSVPIAEGKVTEGRYHHDALGWSMPLPPGWTVRSLEEIREVTGRGRDVLEQSVGERVEENQTDLLYLRGVARGSGFTSARQTFDPAEGPYAEGQEAVFEVVAQAYRDADIPIRVERRQETIGGVVFELMHVSMRARDGDRELAQQYMYDALIGDQGLTVSVTSADAADREAGLQAWRASTFAQRPDAAAEDPPP